MIEILAESDGISTANFLGALIWLVILCASSRLSL